MKIHAKITFRLFDTPTKRVALHVSPSLLKLHIVASWSWVIDVQIKAVNEAIIPMAKRMC